MPGPEARARFARLGAAALRRMAEREALRDAETASASSERSEAAGAACIRRVCTPSLERGDGRSLNMPSYTRSQRDTPEITATRPDVENPSLG